MKYFVGTLISIFFLNSLCADENKSGFEIAAGFGKYLYNDPNLDDAGMGVFSLSYRFDNDFQLELIAGNPDTTLNPNNSDIDVGWTALRGLYHFGGSSFSPYLSVGVDSTDVYSGVYQGVVGLGAKMKISDNFFWRIESNYHTDQGDISILAMIGYSFGQQSSTHLSRTMKVTDSDDDGYSDNVDACPNSPPDSTVDSRGCAIISNIDSDNDGVFDLQDQCPNTPSGALVDQVGCQKELFKEVSVNLQINFDTNKAIVKAANFSEIERVAKFMSEYAGTSVVIEGHTDSRGKSDHNQGLSTRRAEAVAKALIEQFSIASSRVTSKGFGEDSPIASNETAQGRASNRRVVAIIKQQLQEKQWK